MSKNITITKCLRISFLPLHVCNYDISAEAFKAVQFITLLIFYGARKLTCTVRLCFAPLQLSSVKSFLESINDYLKVKDEKLALNISAQRVEGYEVEGINEEIDKVKYFVFLQRLPQKIQPVQRS